MCYVLKAAFVCFYVNQCNKPVGSYSGFFEILNLADLKDLPNQL